MHIGTRIRHIREGNSIKQATMARALDMSQANYCKLESGETELKVKDLEKIAEVLQTEVLFFFSKLKNEPSPSGGHRSSSEQGGPIAGTEAVSLTQLLAAKSEALAAKNALIETQRQQLARREAEIEQLRQENETLLRANEALRTDRLPGQGN
jgi:transcriptional regulator with XRE-family HTH domain